MLAPKSPDEMTTDATITDAARDHIRSYFAEFGAAGEEFERFVIEQLDHLEALQARIADRERQLDLDQEALHRQLDNLQTAQQRLDAASAAVESWVAQCYERPAAQAPSRPNRLCPSMPRNSPRPCPSSRKSEPCSASRSQARTPRRRHNGNQYRKPPSPSSPKRGPSWPPAAKIWRRAAALRRSRRPAGRGD